LGGKKMEQWRLDLIQKVQKLAEELVEDVYSSPFDTNSVRDFLDEISQAIDELEAPEETEDES
jgi:CHASE3 domain sensor protein